MPQHGSDKTGYLALLRKCGSAIPEICFATLAANVRFVQQSRFRPKMPKVLTCTRHQASVLSEGFVMMICPKLHAGIEAGLPSAMDMKALGSVSIRQGSY